MWRSGWTSSFISTVVYSCLIYEVVLVLSWIGVYKAAPLNPAMITAYLSFFHLLIIPILSSIKQGSSSGSKLVFLVNLIWIIMTVVINGILMSTKEGYYRLFMSMRLHCILLTYYFASASLLTIISFHALSETDPQQQLASLQSSQSNN